MPANTKRALCIGLGDYNTQVQIYGPPNDVVLMQEILSHNQWDVSETLGMEDANATNILSKLQELIAASQPGDIILFYFSGHGLKIPDTSINSNGGAFVDALAVSDWGDNENDFIIKNSQLTFLLTTVPKDVVFVNVLDCCHAEGMINSLPGKSFKNVISFFACPESSEEKEGVFPGEGIVYGYLTYAISQATRLKQTFPANQWANALTAIYENPVYGGIPPPEVSVPSLLNNLNLF